MTAAPAHRVDDTTARRARPGRAWGTFAAAIAVFVFAWLFRFNDPGGAFAGLTDDHFFYVVRGWQILFGELPVRDFVDHGAPLHFYAAAAVQTILGRGTLSELVFTVTMLALGAALTFWLCARAAGSVALGLAGAAFHVFLLPRFYNYPKVIVYTAAIPLLWRLADRPGPRPLAWLALATVVGFLLRHDHGFFVAAATLLMLMLVGGMGLRERLRHVTMYAALVAALLAPYALFVHLNGGLGTYAATVLDWAVEERARTPVQFPGVLDNPDGVSDEARSGPLLRRVMWMVRDNGTAWLYYFELTLPVFALLVLAVSRNACRRSWAGAAPKIAVVALLGLILDAGFLRSPLAARLADPSVPLAILLAWLGTAVPRLLTRREWWRPALARVAVPARAALVLTAGPLFAVPAIVLTHGLYDRLEGANMVEGLRPALGRVVNIVDALRRDWDLATWRDRADRPELITLAMYLNACTTPDARIFVQPYIPQVLALSRRAFAGGHADLRPGFFDTPPAEAQTLARMRRQNVPVVLLATEDSLENFRESFPRLTAYFDTAYRTAAEHTFDERFGVTLFVKRGLPQQGTFEPLGWPCFVSSG